MAQKLATDAGHAQYTRRKWLSEVPNGWIKDVLGFRRFSVRGLTQVQGQWNLVWRPQHSLERQAAVEAVAAKRHVRAPGQIHVHGAGCHLYPVVGRGTLRPGGGESRDDTCGDRGIPRSDIR